MVQGGCRVFGKCLVVSLTIPCLDTIPSNGDELIIQAIVQHLCDNSAMPPEACLQAEVLVVQFEGVIQTSCKELSGLADIQNLRNDAVLTSCGTYVQQSLDLWKGFVDRT